MYPILPIIWIIIVIFRNIKDIFYPNWMTEGPGAVFFKKPKNIFASFTWDLYITHSMYVGQFWLCGTHDEIIETSWRDKQTDKYFWREKMQQAGCYIPGAIGHWDG